MGSKVIIFMLLAASWYVFSGENDLFFIICGLVSCAIAMYVGLKIGADEMPKVKISIFKYWLWLVWQVILSTFDVVKQVWAVKPNISPKFLTIKTEQTSEDGLVIYGNSITLTPGTVTVEVDKDKRELVVHSLTKASADGLLNGDMDVRVRKICG